MSQSICEVYNVKVGDVFSGEWGYNMTIPEFFQVTKVTKSSVYLRPLKKNIVSGGGFEGNLEAVPNEFDDSNFYPKKEFLVRVQQGYRNQPMVHVKEPDVRCYHTTNLQAYYNRLD